MAVDVGIRHLHLLVADQERSAAFYKDAFGMEEHFRDGAILFIGTPGGDDSLALHQVATDEERERIAVQGGYDHFGIHLPNAERCVPQEK